MNFYFKNREKTLTNVDQVNSQLDAHFTVCSLVWRIAAT